MPTNTNEILIVGAGPSGMAAAMELQRKGKRFTIVEKTESVGGLSKTYSFGRFRTDNGPHRFFSKNNYLYGFIEDLLGEQWIKVNRYTRFYIRGKFFKYPIELKDTLSNIGIVQAVKAIVDFLIAKVQYHGRELKNFEEYAVSTFGRTIAELNLLQYTEKIWGLPCTQLSVDWANQRIKGLSVLSIIKNFFINGNKPKTLVDQFYYPQFGTGLIYEAIKKRIQKDNDIILNVEPIKIIHAEEKIKAIILSNGRLHECPTIISSIPITTFISLLDPAPSASIFEAVRKLKYRSQVYLFITVNQASIGNDQWIYFPDKAIPFGRISEMKNFSKHMSPKDKTSLFIEFFCWKDDEIWNMSKEDLVTSTTDWLEKLHILSRDKIIETFHLRQEYVYPVYDLEYKNNLAVLKNYLDGFSNLTYIGRPGRFKYTNQDHSLEMGILAARGIIENKKFDVENVGLEKEYFEKGYVQ